MIVSTLFRHGGRFELGEVEVKLLPGIPQLHVVGLPDASMRECGIKLKSALRSCGFAWPQGHQIVVNLRPSYLRKHSSGVDLAVALGVLALTNQLSKALHTELKKSVVYGEIALNGRVFAPNDIARALRATGGRVLLTGKVEEKIRDGRWSELSDLHAIEVQRHRRVFDWQKHWIEPSVSDVTMHESAALALALAVHMNLNVLVAGPQGSGKTTWARALYSLTPPPELSLMLELADMFGDEVLEKRWRPLEQPHHSTTPQAMIGGGNPILPGVISRAHGGLLIMDEFLEFPSNVLESLREPMESGVVEIARQGVRQRWPARFQLVATTNLCLCGRLKPEGAVSCGYSLIRCRSVCMRLSGPLMDRFDLLLFSHEWLKRQGRKVSSAEVKSWIERMRRFAATRGTEPTKEPDWLGDLELSHRRTRSLLRVARGLADLEGSVRVLDSHLQRASKLVITPMETLKRLFA
ncbi:MAG: ATP-binding protein [Bdellovibrionales bacterium]|nr:ATP-binding protein [Bdellovibrionales bacterium]